MPNKIIPQKSSEIQAALMALQAQATGNPKAAQALRELNIALLTAQTTEAAGDPWQPFTLADAYQERPPMAYLAERLFALPSLSVVYAAPGALKSFFLADLAACVAGGLPWLPPAHWLPNNTATSKATRQAPAVWLDFDNGRRRTHDRFKALGRAHNLPPDIPLKYYSMPTPWLDATNKASIGDLILRVNDIGAGLVVIDNLGVVSGNAEENSGDMAQVMSLFRQLAEDTGAAIVLIHHQRKGAAGGLGGRAGDNLRGHSSIEAALDLALWIEREDYSDTLTVRATKVRGEDILPFSAVFTYESDLSGELAKAQFYGIATEDLVSGAAIEKAILEALTGQSLNKSDLAKAVKELLPDVGINRIRERVDRMAALHKVQIAPGKGPTERIYTKV